MSVWDSPASLHHPARAGFARVSLDLPTGKPLAGYGPQGSGHAAWTRSSMWARAMVLEAANGERAAVVVLDLMSASRYLHDQIAAVTGPRLGLGRERLIVCGTHTHKGPSGFYGNSLYDTFTAHDPLHGFHRALADLLVQRAVDAVARAVAQARTATVRVDTEHVWGVSHNRSAEAFRLNEDHVQWTMMSTMPGHGAPVLARDEVRAERSSRARNPAFPQQASSSGSAAA